MNHIKNLAVHNLNKVGEVFSVALGRGLDVNEVTQGLVDELHELYSRRASKSYGRFSNKVADYPTQTHLAAYLKSNPLDFATLTSDLMTTLSVQAQRKTHAAGGHVFFAHFERDGREYLLVSIVTDRTGAQLTAALDVKKIEHLDLDGFRFAGRINITGWLAGETRYVGFLRGKGDVSDYFKEFLGCETSVLEKKDTQDLVDALRHYADEKKIEGADKDALMAKAKSICETAARERRELSLDAFTNELVPNDPDALRTILAEREVNDNFIPNRGVLNLLVRFKARTKEWAVEFDRDALTKGKIKFDPDEKSLKFLNLPEDLVAELKGETNKNDD